MGKIVLLLMCGMFFFSSCGYIEGTVQKAEKGTIVFLGDLTQVKIQIDDREPFIPTEGKHYQFSPGKYTITAFKNENILLKRIIILENQVTTEIRIP